MLRIGIIGLSEGNGHPYSWSAIFNGYDPEYIAQSDFPNIASYLQKQSFPEDQIKGGCISHVWTQSDVLSKQIAASCHIEHIASRPEDMIGFVDAVLLARDDCENHVRFSKPFIEAGLPIFIDKPLANTRKDALDILSLEQYEGQIFTCSALRYAEELLLTEDEKKKIGPLLHISASTVKSWEKYAIHLIEPLIAHDLNQLTIVGTKATQQDGNKGLLITWDNGLTTSIHALGNKIKKGPIQITYYGEHGYVQKSFSDAFSAFKKALTEFTSSAIAKNLVIPREETLRVIDIIEMGL